jgi:T5SS/PEP-CTERM-associated repeat protein
MGGTNTVTGVLYLASDDINSSGKYNLSSTASLWVGGTEYFGYKGTGTFNQTGGSHTVANANGLYLGYYPGSSGTYTQNAGTNQITGSLYLGYLGATNGLAAASGTYNLSDSGSLSVDGNEYIGSSGIGTFSQSGGTNKVSGHLYLSGSPEQLLGGYPAGSGTYDLHGTGSLEVKGDLNVGYTGAGTFNLSDTASLSANALNIGY